MDVLENTLKELPLDVLLAELPKKNVARRDVKLFFRCIRVRRQIRGKLKGKGATTELGEICDEPSRSPGPPAPQDRLSPTLRRSQTGRAR